MASGPNPPAIQAHICVKGASDAIAFYERAGATAYLARAERLLQVSA